MIYNFKWLVRGLYILLVAFYVYTLRELFSSIPISSWLCLKWIIFCSLWNSGLWIITTQWAKKYKLVSFLLYLPTLITSTIFLLWPGWFSALTFFFFLLIILIVFFPWRGNESNSTTTVN